jgi:hypothetical protein
MMMTGRTTARTTTKSSKSDVRKPASVGKSGMKIVKTT